MKYNEKSETTSKDNETIKTEIVDNLKAETVNNFDFDEKRKEENVVSMFEERVPQKPNFKVKNVISVLIAFAAVFFVVIFAVVTSLKSDASIPITITLNYSPTISETKTISKGDEFVVPSNPEDKLGVGYNFVGWFSDAERTKVFDFNSQISKDITIYAKYELKTFSIIFRSSSMNDEVILNFSYSIYAEPVSVVFGQTYTLPTNINNLGTTSIIFLGWDTSLYASEIVYSPGDIIVISEAKDIKLYAVWSK